MGVSVLRSPSPVREKMQGFYTCFTALWLAAYTNASPALSLFNIVKFKNVQCQASATREGTCFTKEECESEGGTQRGECAEGFGVCCEFSDVMCNDVISVPNSYLIKPGASTGAVETGTCRYEICPANSDICRIKYQFDQLTLAAPILGTAGTNEPTLTRSIGSCQSDSLVIGNGISSSPVICGTNTGQHMIMDSDGMGCHTVNIRIGAAPAAAMWDIHVTQHDCKDLTVLETTAGPKGCLQYFLGDANGAGRIDNFGYPGTGFATPETFGGAVTHLQNQQYTICIRRFMQSTRICYNEAVTVITPSIANQNSFGLSTSPNPAAQPATDEQCETDFITIPFGVASTTAAGFAGLANSAFRFCGNFFNNQATQTAGATVCSRSLPFIVGVNFDNSEEQVAGTDTSTGESGAAPTGTVGFHLQFTQS